MNRRILAVVALVGALVRTTLASADDTAARKALIDEAVRARAENDHARALERAEAARAMRATASLLLFIAEEHEHLGYLPEAYDTARECLQIAETEAPSPNHDAVLVGCRSVVADLRARVAVVSWDVPTPRPAGLVVDVAGKRRGDGRRSVAVAPGPIVVEARAPGWLPFTSKIEAPAGGEAHVVIVLERDRPLSRELDAPRERSVQANPAGPILVGVGVATLAVSGVLRLVGNARYGDLEARCAGGCPDGASERSSIERLDTVAFGTALVGAGLVVGGVTWFVLDRPAESKSKSAAWIDASPFGVSLLGRF